MSCKLCMTRKLKQNNCSSFQLENLGILTAHEKTKQLTLKGKKDKRLDPFFSMQCKDDGKGNMQMQDTCYLRGLLPPKLTYRPGGG